MITVFVGFDPREEDAYEVCSNSIKTEVTPLVLSQLRGLYTRPHEKHGNQLWDTISNAPMSTEFSNTRFLVPWLARDKALYCDCDFLWRSNVAELFNLFDPKYAVQVVKHDQEPVESTKMDGQLQTTYPRKNWSSLVLWNLNHPANKRLKLSDVNQRPGSFLHRFGWLEDREIGSLPLEWNWLAGVSKPTEPKAVHYTLGVPSMPGYENAPYADEWRSYKDKVCL